MTCFIGGREGQEPLLHLHFSDPSVQEIQYAKKSFWDQHDLKPITFLGTPERRQDGGLHQDRLKWVLGGCFMDLFLPHIESLKQEPCLPTLGVLALIL